METMKDGHDALVLFKDAVARSRQEQTPPTIEAGHAARLKLMVNLSKSFLRDLPAEVADLLKEDVDGIRLANNYIATLPFTIADCKPLKYLNLKGNCFDRFPKPVSDVVNMMAFKANGSQLFDLPQLEHLDLSDNRLPEIPEDITNMESLRFLALMNNKIEYIPTCLKDLGSLSMIKISGNPLRSEFAAIIDANDYSPPLRGGITENQRDTILTENLKNFLRREAAASDPGWRSSIDGQVNTPRPSIRDGSIRFPVRPSHSGSESASDAPSPGFAKPPLPARSHYRVASGQNHALQGAALRRPGLAPLIFSSERNRSNSESILQASQNNRSKRMGMVTKKNAELNPLDESRQNRSSFHLRGQSHGSALRNRHHNGGINNEYRPPNSRDALSSLSAVVNRLSSLPEDPTNAKSPGLVITTARGVLHTIPQLHSVISSNFLVVSEKSARRLSLERAFQIACLQLEALDKVLNNDLLHFQILPKSEKARRSFRILVNKACTAIISTYLRLGKQISEQFAVILSNGEPALLRNLALSAFGSTVENEIALSNSQSLTPSIQRQQENGTRKEPESRQTSRSSRVKFIQRQHRIRREHATSPTADRPVTATRVQNEFETPTLANQNTLRRPKPNGQPAVPLFVNGRSRSSSRVETYNLPSSTSSVFAMSPSPLGLSSIPGTPLNRSRSSSVAAGNHGSNRTPANGDLLHSSLEAQFQRILQLLDQCVVQGRNVIPWLRDRFYKSLEAAQFQEHNQRVYALWTGLIGHCDGCLGMFEKLSRRLTVLKSQETYDTRYDRNFWQMSTKTLDSISNLLHGVKDAKKLDLVSIETLHRVWPLSKTIQHAAHEIHSSPWMDIAKDTEQPPPPPNPQNSYFPAHGHRYRRSSGSNTSAMTSVPATPLSAALGPAAQAAMPSPLPSAPLPSASLERSFHGGWSERADALLQHQQTMVYRR
ncbi:MAG: hypothetical protein LQ342_003805 [Letrouitia transgressa]|nr:MAG: hypothetical protein LQ342_003805 [Letrouitia transgressa]